MTEYDMWLMSSNYIGDQLRPRRVTLADSMTSVIKSSQILPVIGIYGTEQLLQSYNVRDRDKAFYYALSLYLTNVACFYAEQNGYLTSLN